MNKILLQYIHSTYLSKLEIAFTAKHFSGYAQVSLCIYLCFFSVIVFFSEFFYISENVLCRALLKLVTNYNSRLKILHWLSEKLASLSIMGS